ncbi:hypothetical protein MTO96_049052 [Rhipicephalus appendiculatus]
MWLPTFRKTSARARHAPHTLSGTLPRAHTSQSDAVYTGRRVSSYTSARAVQRQSDPLSQASESRLAGCQSRCTRHVPYRLGQCMHTPPLAAMFSEPVQPSSIVVSPVYTWSEV